MGELLCPNASRELIARGTLMVWVDPQTLKRLMASPSINRRKLHMYRINSVKSYDGWNIMRRVKVGKLMTSGKLELTGR